MKTKQLFKSKRIVTLLLVGVLLLCSFLLPAGATDNPIPKTVTLGDVTGDDCVDAADALQLLLYAVEKPSSIGRVKNAGLMADVDGNNLMDAADALEILQKAVGIREEFTALDIERPTFPAYQEEADWITKNLWYILYAPTWPWPSRSERISPAYRSIFYHYGVTSVPDMLKDVDEYLDYESSGSAGPFSASLFPLFNLQINLHQYVNDWWTRANNDQAIEWNVQYNRILIFVGSVPGRVDEICDSTELTYEEKVFELSKLGLLALPYLQDRIEKGETQWEVCFANQLLGVSEETRLQTLLSCYELDHVWITKYSEETERQVYEKKTAAALPVDALWWCEAHQEELAVIQAWCDSLSSANP